MPLALILGLGGGLFYYSNRGDFLLGQIAAVAMTPMAMHGVWRGGFRKIVMIVVIMGIGAGFGYLRAAADMLLGLAGLADGKLTTPLAVLLSFGIWLTAFVTTKALRASFIDRSRFRRTVDRFAGILVGMTEGGLVVLTLCWMATSLEPFGKTMAEGADTVKGSPRQMAGQTIVRLAQEARIGAMGDVVRKTNPLENVPALRDMVREANRTGQLKLDDMNPETLKQLQDLLKNMPGAGGTDIDAALAPYRQGSITKEKAAHKTSRGR